MSKYEIALSTTEPNNEVGLIKLRQGDVNSQYISSQITENGENKSFDGLKPFFCLMAQGATGQGVSEEPVLSYNAPVGTLTYIASDNALQMVGRNEAYFSFRKQEGDKWIEQLSTRSFNFIVEKSIYSQPFKDSNYWWTFKELHTRIIQYWDSVKNVVNSIKDGAIGDLADAHKDQDGSIYDSLSERFNGQIGKNSDFRKFDKTVIEKMKNEFEERGVNVKWFGAVGNGATDDTKSIQAAIDTGLSVFIPPGKYRVKSLSGFSEGQILSGTTKVKSWGTNEKKIETILIGIGEKTDYVIKNNVWSNGITPTAIVVENLFIDGQKNTNGVQLGNSSSLIGVRIENCINGVAKAKVSTIENCQITSCENGLYQATDSRISNNFIFYNGIGINLEDSNDNIILNNKIEWNGIGVKITKGVFNLISSNIFDRSTTYGIQTTNTTNTTIIANQFERSLENHLYLSGSMFNISSNSFFVKNSEDNQSGNIVPAVAIFLKSVELSSFIGNTTIGKMFNSDGTDYNSKNNFLNNIVNGINPDRITVNLPKTTAMHGQDTKMSIMYPDSLNGSLKNPYNVSLISKKIGYIKQNGNFYSDGGIIKSIYFSQSQIEIIVTNNLADDLEVTGFLELKCMYQKLY